MNDSKKHHYLPVFYLKGFVNSNGQFSIFDHKNRYIKKKEHFPSSHFYEVDRNTVEFKNSKSDLPEKSYSVKDNRYSQLLAYIQSCEGPPLLNTNQMVLLQDFVSNLFWRIPDNDLLFKETYINNPLLQSFLVIKDRLTGEKIDNIITREILNSEAIKKSARTILSDLTLITNNVKDLDHWRISYVPGQFHICSDNPFIFRDNEKPKDVFGNDFILPLTKNHLLVKYANSSNKVVLEPSFGLMSDIAIFLQGKFYSACARRDFLTTISQISSNYEIDKLRQEIFKKLE